MNTKLSEILENRHENYLLPFYWQVGRCTEKLRSQIAEIQSCGIEAICVESRTHGDFGGEGWWEDIGIILDECKKRSMKVWILDDDHFPTGHAGGLLQKKYPERRKWHLVESHIDVFGPTPGNAVFAPETNPEHILIGVYAYKRDGYEETVAGEAIDLTANIKDGLLFWDVPDGCWRITFLYKSRRGISEHQKFYISNIDEDSVDVLIEAIYEPHYAHFAEYFGSTIAGFFSDEPQFMNGYAGQHLIDHGFYDKRVGMIGLALPWNERVLTMMSDELGRDATPLLPMLWFGSEDCKAVRLAYMNAVTKLYRDCFTRRLGDWCRAHGVMYIGHIIEDMNAHARLGCSAGHYFRSLTGQDMSGIDIVLHQVMPGFANHTHTAVCAAGMASPRFYHYVLGKLAASLAHIDPAMQGRAMCEVFGAFGWAESVPFMKWLIDFLLVRGVNHFVPHAFSQTFPNPDCPPHFGGGNQDPQFEGFKALMRYTNKAAHLLCGATHKADAAILYHGEAEWMNYDCMFTEFPAKVLYDDKIDYDILPIDALSSAGCENSRLTLNGEDYGCLIVPTAATLPEEFLREAGRLAGAGVPVWFVDAKPENCSFGEVVALESLASEMRARGLATVEVCGESELLRVYHCKGESDIFMFFNESYNRTTRAAVRLGVTGEYASLDLISGESFSGVSDGEISLELEPFESRIVVFGENRFPKQREYRELMTLDGEYVISLADSENMDDFKPYKTTRELTSISAELPRFSGRMRYETEFTLDKPCELLLDLGSVGDCAQVRVNGSEPIDVVCNPYRADISRYVKPGANKLEITVSNTLANRLRDRMSSYMQLKPSGLTGKVKLFEKVEVK